MSIQIRPVTDKKQEKTFIHFPWKIYENDPNWVPPLLMDIKLKLNKKKHPFYEFGEIQLFLAYKGEKTVGRIAAIQNKRYNEYHNCKTGFFGFFECINDQEVANALFDTARGWLKAKGLNVLHGPASPSSNYDYGLLVEGFDDPPRLMMTYNPAYYPELFEKYGLKKATGLLAYRLKAETVLANKKLERVANMVEKRYEVKMRPINMKNFFDEVKLIKKIYDNAWIDNWGFVPVSDAETEALAKELKMVVEPKLAQFMLNKEGEVIGMFVALPDFNAILKSFNGRLFPFNFLKMFFQKKKIKYVRIWALGLMPEYRNKGLDAIMYLTIIRNGMELGYRVGEASWILEDNDMMNRGLEVVNGEIYKRYNVYELSI
ncbi:MAG: hypothetical protein AAF502_10070 [Bacteroidota bacterium]